MKLRVLIAALGVLMVLAGVGWLSMQDSVNIQAHAHDATSSALEPKSGSITTNDESPKPDGAEAPSENDSAAVAESPKVALPVDGINVSTAGEEIDPNTEPGRYILQMLAAARAGDIEARQNIMDAVQRCESFSYQMHAEPPPSSASVELQALWLDAHDQVTFMCERYFAAELSDDESFREELHEWRQSMADDPFMEMFYALLRQDFSDLPEDLQDASAVNARISAMITDALTSGNVDQVQRFPFVLAKLAEDGVIQFQTPERWDYSQETRQRSMQYSMPLAACEVFDQCDWYMEDVMLNECLRDWYTCVPANTSLYDYTLEAWVPPRDTQAFMDTYAWLVQVFENRDLAALGLLAPDDP